MADNDNVKVTVLKSFPLGGKIVEPGPAEVPADKVERLAAKGLIARPDGAPIKAEDGMRVEAAAARIAASLSVTRGDGESLADHVERIADAAESKAEAEASAPNKGESAPAAVGRVTLKGELPEQFPGFAALKAGGITTFEKLLEIKTKEDLIGIKGVGDKTAADITEAIGLLMAVANKQQQ